MRILTWNINGIRTLPQYHPWNTLKKCEAILDELNADIICFQEVKTTRKALDALTAVPGKYDAFFSFPVNKGGYSGVSVYTNSGNVIPLRAEEGLSGFLQPKPPLSDTERISQTYPTVANIDLMADDEGTIPANFIELDSEGRALVIDFGLFVLINVYCVADSADTRYHYKMNFNYLLQERVRILIDEKREVLVVGDLNACPSPLDHCEGNMPKIRANFFDLPHRNWLREWIAPNGPLIDIVREFWPEREGMYTCWNTKISAREGNYGTRIDFILATPGLRPWIKTGDIQASVKGSDHCPVFIDLYDSITTDNGEELSLRQFLRPINQEPPRLCAKFWDEFSTKQTTLSSFFKKQPSAPSISTQSLSSAVSPPISASLHSASSPDEALEVAEKASSQDRFLSGSNTFGAPRKRKAEIDANVPKKIKIDRNGQSKLSSFFVKPSGSSNASQNITKLDSESLVDERELQIQKDLELATSLAQAEEPAIVKSQASTGGGKEVWSHLLSPIQAPNCLIHGEPAKEFTVNKTGPNKGKRFFICSRPVGPGYDMGKSKRPRGEVDTTYRCDFFKWSADVKREALQRAAGGSQ